MVRFFLCLLVVLASLPCMAAEAPPTLIVTTPDASLYAKDEESKVLATLDKGEVLMPLAQGVGTGVWYMVRTSKGVVGWVHATDVASGSKQADEVFRDVSKVNSPNRRGGDTLAECLTKADEAYRRSWNKTCEEAARKGIDCGLSGFNVDVLKRDHRAARDECIKVHGIGKVVPGR